MAKFNRRNLESALSEAERALAASRSRVAELEQANRDLEARTLELGSDLDRRSSAGPAAGEATTDQEAKLEDALSREWRLARRVAELEAILGAEPLTNDATDARDLAVRIDTLTLQLDAARTREDALAVRAVHAERTLADTGARLADLGERAEQADALEVSLAELREETSLALADAIEQIEALRARLEEAARRATALESDLAAAQSATAAAEEATMLADEKASAAEARLNAAQSELASTTAILVHLEEVFAAVRDRVDHPGETPPDAPELGGQAVPPDGGTEETEYGQVKVDTPEPMQQGDMGGMQTWQAEEGPR